MSAYATDIKAEAEIVTGAVVWIDVEDETDVAGKVRKLRIEW